MANDVLGAAMVEITEGWIARRLRTDIRWVNLKDVPSRSWGKALIGFILRDMEKTLRVVGVGNSLEFFLKEKQNTGVSGWRDIFQDCEMSQESQRGRTQQVWW